LEKVKAVMKKRTGDIAGAREGLAGVKALEKRLEEILAKKQVKPNEKLIEKPNGKPVEKPVEKIVEESVEKLPEITQPVDKPAERHVEIVAETLVEPEKPVEIIDEKTMGEPAEKPVETQVETSVEKPPEPAQAAEKPVEKSVEMDKPAEIADERLIAPENQAQNQETIPQEQPVLHISTLQPQNKTPESPISPTQALLPLLQTRIAEYKAAAIHFKKLNDITKAREMLMVSKGIEGVRESVEAGLGVGDGWVCPDTPVLSNSPSKPSPPEKLIPQTEKTAIQTEKIQKPTLGTTNQSDELSSAKKPEVKTPPKPTAEAVSKQTKLIQHMLTLLTHQIGLCTSISAHHFRRGNKQGALIWHKEKKAFVKDQEALEALKTSIEGGANVGMPSAVMKNVSYELERQFPEIQLTEIEVCFLRGHGLVHEGKPVDSTIVFDLGWPVDSEGDTKMEGKGETNTVSKSSDPEWKYVKRIACVDRSQRAFHRFLEKKKMFFDVYHHRGWLRGRVLIGKGSLKMDGLLTSCEVHSVVGLMDPVNPRKGTGGEVEVRVRMRMPARENEVLKVDEPWMYVDWQARPMEKLAVEKPLEKPSEKSVSVAVEKPLEKPLEKSVSVAVEKQVEKHVEKQVEKPSALEKLQPVKTVSPATSRTPSPTPPNQEEMQDLILSFQDTTSIVSNMVIEHEIANVRKLIANKTGDEEEMQSTLSALLIREQMLVMAVQSGTLTPQQYLDQLSRSVEQTKVLALKFKKVGKLDWAKKAMERMLLMQREIDEVKQMI
jgi:hypothetical protein